MVRVILAVAATACIVAACTAEQKQTVDRGVDALKQMCVALESYSPDAGLVLRLHVPEAYRIQAIDGGAP